jgi:hypothetical protein
VSAIGLSKLPRDLRWANRLLSDTGLSLGLMNGIIDAMRLSFNGRTSGCQSESGSSILPSRTVNFIDEK